MLKPLVALLDGFKETDLSWIVRRDQIDKNLNLDIKNPHFRLSDLRSLKASNFLPSICGRWPLRQKRFKLNSLLRLRRSKRQRCVLSGKVTLNRMSGSARHIPPAQNCSVYRPRREFANQRRKLAATQSATKSCGPDISHTIQCALISGRLGSFRENTPGGITSPDYVVFYCGPHIHPDFVYHFLRSEAGRHAINQKTKGSVRFRLYYQQLALIELPVPADLKVQKKFADACNRLETLRRQVSEASLGVQSCFNAQPEVHSLGRNVPKEFRGQAFMRIPDFSVTNRGWLVPLAPRCLWRHALHQDEGRAGLRDIRPAFGRMDTLTRLDERFGACLHLQVEDGRWTAERRACKRAPHFPVAWLPLIFLRLKPAAGAPVFHDECQRALDERRSEN